MWLGRHLTAFPILASGLETFTNKNGEIIALARTYFEKMARAPRGDGGADA